MRTLTIFLFCASTLWSQAIFNPQAASVSLYLDLTDPQAAAIADLNRQLAAADRARSQRQIQLQSEITQETARDPIDVNALGLRYRELELIRREMETQRSRTREQIQALLTPAQKAKLNTLQQALDLHTTACEAIDQNILVLPRLILTVPPGFPETTIFALGPYISPCVTNTFRFTPFGDTPRSSDSPR